MTRELTPAQLIERSISVKYRKELWAPFITAIKEYKLIEPDDHIAVCISGGKDSMCMAELFKILHRHSEIPFEVTYLVMDPGYNEINRQYIENNLKLLDIPAVIFETNVFAIANNNEEKPCYLCARMRRGHLYNKAKELGCNKIALGHHLNDVIETTLMSMMWSSKIECIVPKARSEHFAGMELIRPMYGIKEDDIKAWARYNGLQFIQCACRFTENCTICDNGGGGSKRQETKNLIRRLKKDNPEIEHNLFRAIHAVHIKTFPGYVQNGEKHSFLENYEANNPHPSEDTNPEKKPQQ